MMACRIIRHELKEEVMASEIFWEKFSMQITKVRRVLGRVEKQYELIMIWKVLKSSKVFDVRWEERLKDKSKERKL